MKLTPLLLLFTTSAFAQTTPKPATPATAAHPPARAAAPCVKLPDISPKVPAVPAGLPCAKGLYTITTIPSVKLENISPLIVPDQLRETLGLETSTFTLAYIDTRIGTGPLAAPHKFYTIHYTGYLTDGTVFDSSHNHPPENEPITIEYGKHNVIPGWDTGFDGMHVGGKRRLFIPFQLAYGPNGKPPTIPAKAELIFDVELVSQSDTRPAPKAPPMPPTPPPAPTAPPATPPPAAAPATPPADAPKP
jgi:peptidylprolyl isomerase